MPEQSVELLDLVLVHLLNESGESFFLGVQTFTNDIFVLLPLSDLFLKLFNFSFVSVVGF